ncbi:hypothetical protein Dimus_027078 [Dionaea muscipula]
MNGPPAAHILALPGTQVNALSLATNILTYLDLIDMSLAFPFPDEFRCEHLSIAPSLAVFNLCFLLKPEAQQQGFYYFQPGPRYNMVWAFPLTGLSRPSEPHYGGSSKSVGRSPSSMLLWNWECWKNMILLSFVTLRRHTLVMMNPVGALSGSDSRGSDAEHVVGTPPLSGCRAKMELIKDCCMSGAKRYMVAAVIMVSNGYSSWSAGRFAWPPCELLSAVLNSDHCCDPPMLPIM